MDEHLSRTPGRPDPTQPGPQDPHPQSQPGPYAQPGGQAGPYAQPGPYAQQGPYAQPWPGQWPAQAPRRRRPVTAVVAGGLAVAVAAGGVAVGHYALGGNAAPSTNAASATPQVPSFGWGQNYGRDYGSGAGDGTTRAATSTEAAGVVDINTVLDYGTARAAGTGLVLTANGEILTNNHVVDEATSISVTVVSTGRTYTAKVVGTDPGDDIAVIQLSGASGLTTASLATSVTGVSTGDTVTAVGNAGGTGTLTAATGAVTATGQSITATDDSGQNAERLTGLIQVDADIQAGDSGGPLYSGGKVIGIDTAASSSNSAVSEGFAIPITTAVAIADRIESGEDSATIHQGTPAFLGIQLADATGARVAGVIDSTPAAALGLTAGDTITAVDRTRVTTAESLSTALATHDAGDQVRLTWTDAAGTSHTATTTLIAGPAD
jgi:S1-C subfamily serine protease